MQLRALVLLAPWLACAALADDSARIAQLEAELAALKRVVEQLQAARAHSATPAPAQETPADEAAPATPSIRIGGFGHAQYDFASASGPGADAENHFAIGGVDLFITSQITERWSFLNETVFEFDSGGENVLDVERVLIQFDYADWLRVAAGRGHLPLGYWNRNFHHGTFLQTTVERPLMYAFEDDGGILPIHFVGLELAGNIDLRGAYLSYALDVGNGRGRDAGKVQLIEDANDSKMWSVSLTLHPSSEEGVGIGATVVRDRVPADASAGRPDAMVETLLGGHAFFVRSDWEVLVEGFWMDHARSAGLSDFAHWGGFGQLSYAFDRLRPYYRFDWIDTDGADPYFAGVAEDLEQHTLGIRFDLNEFVASKLEYRRLKFDVGHANEAAAQLSFAF